ncbi:MAG TPA: phosphoglycerate kinase [Thermoanaerobaculaceae bacterium]|nr:phosphoglycerate kinase [Thermoanaerobaculaceae bacterium]
MALRSMDTLNVTGRRVLLRLDLNVPLKEGRVLDDTRVREAAPTVRTLAERGAIVIACSHLGRAKGKPDPALSLAPVAPVLEKHAGRPVRFVPDVVGQAATNAVAQAKPGDVLLLENLRFEAGEEKNDPAFCTKLAALAEVYVNDAFGTAHRAHASTAGVAAHFSELAAGPLMAREIAALSKVRDNPERPFVAVVGGAKISGKLETLTSLANRANTVVLVGGMANTFLLAEGTAVGTSLVEADLVGTAKEILATASARGVEVVLPTDVVVATSPEAPGRTVNVDGVAAGEAILDIGPRTQKRIAEVVAEARTVFWNGPAGVFEKPAFAAGTLAIAQALAASRAFTVVGGGESVAAVQQAGVAAKLSHVSTGGGASLEFLAGETLPGVAVLEEGNK